MWQTNTFYAQNHIISVLQCYYLAIIKLLILWSVKSVKQILFLEHFSNKQKSNTNYDTISLSKIETRMCSCQSKWELHAQNQLITPVLPSSTFLFFSPLSCPFPPLPFSPLISLPHFSLFSLFLLSFPVLYLLYFSLLFSSLMSFSSSSFPSFLFLSFPSSTFVSSLLSFR